MRLLLNMVTLTISLFFLSKANIDSSIKQYKNVKMNIQVMYRLQKSMRLSLILRALTVTPKVNSVLRLK